MSKSVKSGKLPGHCCPLLRLLIPLLEVTEQRRKRLGKQDLWPLKVPEGSVHILTGCLLNILEE